MLNGQVFKPIGIPAKDLPRIELYEDELEALRLCDMEDLTQEEAGVKMGISRGTVQRLLQSGRRKLIKAIVERYALIIG